MFSRSSSYIYSALKTESVKTGVRHSAQSKKNRISVQLLKDFPGVGVRGQVIAVKPSAMINRLHPYNGAIYLNFPGAEPVIPVVSKSAASAAAAALQKQQQPKLKKPKVDAEQSKTLLSMEELLSIDLNVLSSEELDLIFAKLPKKLLFVKQSNEKVITKPITKENVISQLQSALSKSVRKDDAVLRFLSSKSTSIEIKTESDDSSELIEKLGNYYVVIKNGDKEETITLIVNSSSEK